MKINTGVLTDGDEIKVRQLRLFELEDVGPDIPDDFEYKIESGDGNTYTIIYPLQERIKTPPLKPTTDDKWANIEWERYQAALSIRQKQLEARHRKLKAISSYILSKCIEKDDLDRITDPLDYAVIYRLAICPEVNMQLIQAELKRFYLANWAGSDILEMMKGIKASSSEFLATRVWEYQLMNKLGLDIDSYSNLNVSDRARRIISFKLEDWLSVIYNDEEEKKRKNKI